MNIIEKESKLKKYRCYNCGKMISFKGTCSGVCKRAIKKKNDKLLEKRFEIADEMEKLLPALWLDIVHKLNKKYKISSIAFGLLFKRFLLSKFNCYPSYEQSNGLVVYKIDKIPAIKIYKKYMKTIPDKILHSACYEVEQKTPRVLKLWNEGTDIKEIAKEMKMSPRTVKKVISQSD